MADLSVRAAIVWNIYWRTTCCKLEVDNGYVVTRCGDIILISVYLSTNMSIGESERAIEALERVLQKYNGQPLLLAGDFNAQSRV